MLIRGIVKSVTRRASCRVVPALIRIPRVDCPTVTRLSLPFPFAIRTFSTTMSSRAIPMPIADNTKPNVDKVIQDITEYVHNYEITSPLAWETARLCLIDTLGCGLEALNFEQCTKLLGPVVEGTVVPNGTRVPGTSYQLDPIRGAFNIGTAIRWLDYNDCWLAAEWGHPSDNLGGILAVSDWLSRTNKSAGMQAFKIKDVLEAMIKAHEIQGCLALENSFNRVGLDHVVLVKVATTAVVSKLLGLTKEQTSDAVSQAWVDGQSLRTYRHAPNTMSRKSWAAGDACSRAVNLALMVKNGAVQGIPSVLSAKVWGFYDVLFDGREFKFQRPYASYVMENVLFKISFPAEFHSQTACEAAMTVYAVLNKIGKTSEDIATIRIRTQEAAIRIIDKKGPLNNYADRDHCIQYMIAIPLIFGRLTASDYNDSIASDPRIDVLREKMTCVEDKNFSSEYHNPEKRSIGNALLVTLKDGTELPEVEVEYPVGHKFRREEGIPLLVEKFKRHLHGRLGERVTNEIYAASENLESLIHMDVDSYVDMFVTKS